MRRVRECRREAASAADLPRERVIGDTHDVARHFLAGLIVTRDTAGDRLFGGKRAARTHLHEVGSAHEPAARTMIELDCGAPDGVHLTDGLRKVPERRAAGT